MDIILTILGALFILIGIAGCIVPIILGPFAGAVLGGLTRSEDLNKAIRSGLGSLLGFLIGTGLKFVVSGFLLYHFFKAAF